ncbi:PQQ-binding-like beta-propeller repeat protein [Streptomyces sp. NPDC051018]|uniref:outer membrane protein assembly factor BamB family protein n=1 Tax=Streptomyces sp. NPDC051018 TaxID=3365639 RepID=UPI0037A2D91C
MSPWPTEHRILSGAVAAAVACLLAACGGGTKPADDSPRNAGASKPSASFPGGDKGSRQPQGPPEAFAEDGAVLDGQFPDAQDHPADMLALGDELAYGYHSGKRMGEVTGIDAFRLGSGDTAWRAKVPEGTHVSRAPALVGDTVVGAFATRTEGEGTVPGHYGIRVVAYDARTGEERWTRELVTDRDSLGLVPEVVAGRAGRVLVTWAGSGFNAPTPTSALLDTRDGRVVWTAEDFEGVDLEDRVAVGIRADGSTFVGKSVSGKELWKRRLLQTDWGASPDPGPGLTLVDGPMLTSVSTGESMDAWLLDPLTGKTRLDLGTATSNRCRYDGRSTTICSERAGAVVAVDVRTARVLWRLPDKAANRVEPTVTAAWQGIVYAEGVNGAMTLDARTGKDRRTGLPLAPQLVNDKYGIVSHGSDERGVEVFRATG